MLFSFNGIDYVSPDDRLLVLAEVGRVLKLGGLLFFSSHNLDCEDLTVADGVARSRLTAHHLKLAKRLASYLESSLRRRQRAGQTIVSKDFSVLNDDELYHALRTYYIRKPSQLQLLRCAGFEPIHFYLTDGREVQEGNTPKDCYMLHYLSRRGA